MIYHTVKILVGLLALQLLLALGLYSAHETVSEQERNQPLLNIDWDGINQIEISDGAQTSVLAKTDGRWQLPQISGLPVETAKLTPLFEQLAGLKTGWPVTSNENSYARFDVAENNYQRRINLMIGDKSMATLLLGTSPEFRRSYARRIGDNAVYTTALSAANFSANDSDWLDKTLLAAADIQTIQGPDFELVKAGENWQLREPVENSVEKDKSIQSINTENLTLLITAFQTLQVNGTLNNPSAEKGITYIVNSNGNQWRYSFMRGGDQYGIKRDDIDTAFLLNQQIYDKITHIKYADLVAEKKPN